MRTKKRRNDLGKWLYHSGSRKTIDNTEGELVSQLQCSIAISQSGNSRRFGGWVRVLARPLTRKLAPTGAQAVTPVLKPVQAIEQLISAQNKLENRIRSLARHIEI
jgi:hypothetical protein